METTKELFELALSLQERRIPFSFVTILESCGSAPRGAGAHMIVLADGASHGTVGGGNLEYLCIRHATELLSCRRDDLRSFSLRESSQNETNMICGGEVSVLFQYLSPEDPRFFPLCREILACWEASKSCWLLLDLTCAPHWSMGCCIPSKGLLGFSERSASPLPFLSSQPLSSHARCFSLKERAYYSEPLVREGSVYLFGAGHVARELVPLLSRLDFRCVIFDDRDSFASPALFPDAFKCITGDFAHLDRYLSIQPQDYVCVMSRGHEYDYLIQKQILATPAAYIGVMGSRRKKEATQKKLLDDGFTEEEILRIKTPIGLSIHAKTPAEIAVSIAAELIALRAESETPG